MKFRVTERELLAVNSFCIANGISYTKSSHASCFIITVQGDSSKVEKFLNNSKKENRFGSQSEIYSYRGRTR